MRIIIVVLIAGLYSCQQNKGRSFIPGIPEYKDAKREVIILNKKLKEISGMFYQKDGRIAAMNDEIGRIFLFNLATPDSIETIEWGGKGDYEDIVKVDSVFYVLESNGNLHQVFGENNQKEFKFEQKKKFEFESLYYQKNTNKLVLITKDHKESGKSILAYSFDLSTQTFSDSPYFSIPMQQVFLHLKNTLAECKPSAAAINFKMNKLFIIASIGKVIIQCNPDGKVEKVYKINPMQFPQPEGVTFAPNGDMYISNEGVHGKATILKFPYGMP